MLEHEFVRDMSNVTKERGKELRPIRGGHDKMSVLVGGTLVRLCGGVISLCLRVLKERR